MRGCSRSRASRSNGVEAARSPCRPVRAHRGQSSVVSEFLPFIVIGLTTGAVYGLAGTGLVLTYKTSGIFNFAYGAIAAMAVFVFYYLHSQHGMPWPWAAVLVLFVLSPIEGLGLELLGPHPRTGDGHPQGGGDRRAVAHRGGGRHPLVRQRQCQLPPLLRHQHHPLLGRQRRLGPDHRGHRLAGGHRGPVLLLPGPCASASPCAAWSTTPTWSR